MATKEKNEEQEKRQTELPSREEYNEFIKDLSFKDVRWKEAHFVSKARREDVHEPGTILGLGVEYNPLSEDFTHFEVTARVEVKFIDQESDKELGTITASLALEYESSVALNEKLFRVFSAQNVPLNAWPYLREYIHQTSLRFGWSPLVLPAYKTLSPVEEEASEKST